jgi:hypothetical protein
VKLPYPLESADFPPGDDSTPLEPEVTRRVWRVASDDGLRVNVAIAALFAAVGCLIIAGFLISAPVGFFAAAAGFGAVAALFGLES